MQSATGGAQEGAAPQATQVEAVRSTSLQQGQPPRLRVAEPAQPGTGPSMESLADRLIAQPQLAGLSREAILRSVPQVLAAPPPSATAEKILV